MHQKKTKKRISSLGRRTGLDVKARKTIKVNDDGIEDFDDYWTSSEEDALERISPPLCSSPVNVKAPRMSSFMKNLRQSPRNKLPEKISFNPSPRKRGKQMPLTARKINFKKKLLPKRSPTVENIFSDRELQTVDGDENPNNSLTHRSAKKTDCGSEVFTNNPSSLENSPREISHSSKRSPVDKSLSDGLSSPPSQNPELEIVVPRSSRHYSRSRMYENVMRDMEVSTKQSDLDRTPEEVLRNGKGATLKQRSKTPKRISFKKPSSLEGASNLAIPKTHKHSALKEPSPDGMTVLPSQSSESEHLSPRSVRCLLRNKIDEIITLKDEFCSNITKTDDVSLINQSEAIDYASKPKKKTRAKRKRKVTLIDSERRRSQRTKFPILERWRNQRLHINYDNGNIASVEVEEGSKPDNSSLDVIVRHQRYIEKLKKRTEGKWKRGRLQNNTVNLEQVRNNLDKTEVIDPVSGQENLVHLHWPHKYLLWTVPSPQDENNASYVITKSFANDMISFGFIEIGVNKKKPVQCSPNHNVAFNIVKGDRIKVHIHQSTLLLKELDFFVVPAGNSYSIHNMGKTAALINFSTFRTPLFDYQFPNDGGNSESASHNTQA